MILEADMVIENAIKYVKKIFADDCSGHDYYQNHHSTSINHFYEKLLLPKDMINYGKGCA